MIDLTLCGSCDEEEDPVKNSAKASCSSPVLISSDLDLEDFEPAFEYVYNFLFLVKLADLISCLHFTCVTIGLKWKTQYPVLLKRTLVLLIPSKSKVSLSLSLTSLYNYTIMTIASPTTLLYLNKKAVIMKKVPHPIQYIYIYIYVTGFGKTLRMGSARDSRNARFSSSGRNLSESRFCHTCRTTLLLTVAVFYGG